MILDLPTRKFRICDNGGQDMCGYPLDAHGRCPECDTCNNIVRIIGNNHGVGVYVCGNYLDDNGRCPKCALSIRTQFTSKAWISEMRNYA